MPRLNEIQVLNGIKDTLELMNLLVEKHTLEKEKALGVFLI